MCGFAGFIDLSRSTPAADLEHIVGMMNNTLRHRGPDDGGSWIDVANGLALGHRRLSIIDLTPEGQQPMQSACGRYVIAFNGEIYNYRDIKSELLDAGHQSPLFRGHSDTEVLLAAISVWGLARTLARLNGMFAFALWDKQVRTLTLARDRLGKKPVYFGWTGRSFSFGSELKALRAYPEFNNPIDRDVLTSYLRHSCIPASYTIYEGIYKLPPATSLTLSPDLALRASNFADIATNIQPYWSPLQVFEAGQAGAFASCEDQMLDDLDGLLRDAVAARMISDVPLGAFLSGGIDSSLVVALMQAQSVQRVKTFTIGFHEAAHNEAKDARRVAEHLGTDHYELYLSPKDALDVVPLLPTLFDEPFADSSQIPTFLVSKFAREHVTVALSGDGGDELFGGYNRYFWAPRIWEKIAPWPLPLRRTAARALNAVSPEAWTRFANTLKIRHRTPADKIQKIAGCLAARTPGEMYRALVSHWDQPETLVLGGREPQTTLDGLDESITRHGFAPAMMFTDMVSYLPDDILVKVDRASMGVSLEVRAPLLDYRVAEFAAQVPLNLKICSGQGKYLLRKLIYRYVPQELIERPKMGFEMPIASWLRGPLRDWAETLLDERKLEADGYLDPTPIRQKWQEHLAGRRNWQFHLWDILMFQAWKDVAR